MTTIEWTQAPGYKGETWNPATGCDRLSPGCGHCYARTMARRLKAMGNPRYQVDGDGPGFGVQTHDDLLDEPLRWRKPRMVFVNSMSDVFHDEIPDTFIAAVYDVMRRSPGHVFQVLTKRPQRALDWHLRYASAFERFSDSAWPLPNVWLGVSVESWRFNWRATVLQRIPAAVRFVSAEPLLDTLYGKRRLELDGIGWVIAGAESGHGARPMSLDHVRELRDACQGAGAAFFFKQDAVNGRKVSLPELDGRVWNEWPIA